MSVFDERSLRPEETGGFNSGDEFDDNFIIKPNQNYPAKIPNFDLKDIYDIPEETDEINDFQHGDIKEAEKFEIPKKGTVWDLFDNSSDNDDEFQDTGYSKIQYQGIDEKEEDRQSPISHDEFETKEAIPFDKSGLLDDSDETKDYDKAGILDKDEPIDYEKDYLSKKEYPESTVRDFVPPEDNADDYQPERGIIEESIDDSTPSEEASDDSDIIDPAFMQMLKTESEESSRRLEKKANIDNAKIEKSSEEKKKLLDNFVPVENLTNANVIDISKLDADHPSNYGIKATVPAERIQEVDKKIPIPEKVLEKKVKVKKIKKEKPPKPPKPIKVKEKKNRKFPWLIILISSAAMLLFFLIGIILYLLMWKPYKAVLAEKALKKNITITQVKKTDVKPKIVNNLNMQTQKADSIKKNNSDTSKSIISNDKLNKDTLKSFEKRKLSENKSSQNKKEIKTPKELPKIKDINKEQKNILKTKPIQANNTNTKQDKKSYIIDEKPLYVVQVYISPSREDAEYWLKRLQRKNIKDGFITTQKIRDKNWYRVRYGSFATREEAKSSALKLGFDQSWIDRVR